MRLKYDNEYHAPTGRGMDKLSISQGVALGYKYKAPSGPIPAEQFDRWCRQD
jgi:hypothetical protein